MVSIIDALVTLGGTAALPQGGALSPALVAVPFFEIRFPDIDPVALELGPLVLRWYALAYIAGLVIGWRYVALLMRRDTLWPGGQAPMAPSMAEDLLFWMTIGVVIGGRLGFVLFYDPSLLWTSGPSTTFDVFGLFELALPRVIAVWEGGMAFHGGMLGVAIGVAWFARRHGVSLLQVGDAVAAAAPIGLFFGRIANFINGELWGRPTDVPWGMRFPQVELLAPQYPWLLVDGENVPRHPSQLYEAALEGALLFAVLAWLIWRADALRRPGLVAGAFLLGYGLARGFVEFFRQWNVELGFDFELFGVGFTRGQTLCLPMILAGLALLYLARRRAGASASV